MNTRAPRAAWLTVPISLGPLDYVEGNKSVTKSRNGRTILGGLIGKVPDFGKLMNTRKKGRRSYKYIVFVFEIVSFPLITEEI